MLVAPLGPLDQLPVEIPLIHPPLSLRRRCRASFRSYPQAAAVYRSDRRSPARILELETLAHQDSSDSRRVIQARLQPCGTNAARFEGDADPRAPRSPRQARATSGLPASDRVSSLRARRKRSGRRLACLRATLRCHPARRHARRRAAQVRLRLAKNGEEFRQGIRVRRPAGRKSPDTVASPPGSAKRP